MDTNRSEEHEEASYSDDFEHDVESQDSPISEDKVEIKVFKSAVGSLTVQPKKIPKNLPMTPDDNSKSARTLSELSLLQMKSKPPATAGGILSKCGSNSVTDTNMTCRSFSLKGNLGSKTSLNQALHLRRPLAQEKVDPHDIPASVAGSLSSVSLSRLRNRSATATGFSRGSVNNIRRVVAHTSIKEKSYASAKFKTYHNPPLPLRGSNQPMKVGLAKPNTNVAQRVASAKRMTIMDLKSKIKLLQDEIEKLKKENRFLNHLHHRQDNALRKWEGKDAELPKLLNQHKDEIRSLQEQLRRAHQNAREHNEKLSVRDKKILRLETEMDRLKALVHEEHLQDRHNLQQDLDITRMNLAGAEKRIREYMRHVEILEKNHKHQLAAQERKFIKVNTHTYELQQVVANLKLALRNKDRMLNYIQMRSSGRTLIRAYHAERLDRSDDMLYGTSIQTDLNRPYQPPPLAPLMKSHSFDFGNSRCSSPLLDNMRDYEFFSRRFSDDHRNNKNTQSYHKGMYSQDERFDEQGKLSSRPMSRHSQSLESVVRPQPTSPKNKGNSRSFAAPCSIKSHGRKDSEFNSKSESKVRSNVGSFRKSPRSLKKIQSTNKNLKELDKRQQKVIQGDRQSVPSADRATKSSAIMSHSTKTTKPQGNKKVSGKPSPIVENAESKELIYSGSTKGFKYEGPFMSSTCNLDCTRDSTEVLYSPKSDKLSERSLSSTCTSHTVTSSRSEEIISNIDILSARIRESCVLVPPPEETFKTPRGHEDTGAVRSVEPGVQTKMQFSSKPTIGPGGDSTVLSQPVLLATGQATTAHENKQSSFQNGLLQSVQMVTHNATEQDICSSRSNQSYVSPRVQLHSISLPSVGTSQPLQQSQFQLAQPNYVTQITDQHVSSPTSQQQLSIVASNNQSQMLDNNAIQYVSPRIQPGYTPVHTVNVIPQQLSLQHESHLHAEQGQSATTRLSPEFPYFSFATNSDNQERMSPAPNVAIFQANPSYGHPQQGYISPRASSLTHGSVNSQQAVLVAPSARNAYPRVGFYNSGQVSNNGGEQSLPSINNNGSNKNQSLYNPSYYVNLGSWK